MEKLWLGNIRVCVCRSFDKLVLFYCSRHILSYIRIILTDIDRGSYSWTSLIPSSPLEQQGQDSAVTTLRGLADMLAIRNHWSALTLYNPQQDSSLEIKAFICKKQNFGNLKSKYAGFMYMYCVFIWTWESWWGQNLWDPFYREISGLSHGQSAFSPPL